MASFLRGLRGNGEHPNSEARVRELADRMLAERERLEKLLTKARSSSTELGRITEPVAKIGERLAALERQLSAVESRVPAVAGVQDRTDTLLKTHRDVQEQLGESGREVGRITSQLGELRALVETATGLRRDLVPLLEHEGPFRALKDEAAELRGWVTDLADGYNRLREGRDELARTGQDASTRLESIERATQTAVRLLEDHRGRVDELERTIARLTQLASGAADTKHQLLTLKSLADQVTQKIAALEKQRDAVEHVAKDVSRLDDLVHRVDTGLRQQEGQMANLHSLAAEVQDIRSLYESVTARSQEISIRQHATEEQEQATRQRLAELGQQLGRAAERFDLECRGLETVTLRITDLRAALKDCEERMAGLDASRATMLELGTKVENVWNRVGFLMADIVKLDEQAKRMRILRDEAQRIDQLMQDAAARSAEIEKGAATTEAVVRDLAALNATQEAIKNGLDQMRGAQEEMTRMRGSQVETEEWLKAIQGPVAELRERVQQLEAANPTVESVAKKVERVLDMTEVIAARRQSLDEMQIHLAELAALAGQLDDRTKAFRSRLDIAEGRFISVTRQAEEVERIANVISAVSRTVVEVDQRLGDLNRSTSSLEGRTQNLENVAERVQRLDVELGLRQEALEKASEHLTRASVLRQEAADAVEQLDERTRTVRTTLDSVENGAQRLESLSEALDARAAALATGATIMAQFEEHLRKWELAKQELQLSEEQLASRQSTVDALKANVRQMFDLAERTADDLKAAVAAQGEIQRSKATLEELLRRLREADAVTAGLELRKQDIEHAERRLARAEAVLLDIQSSLETLHNQKAMLDQVIEQTGSLTFQVQQAEALIERLRKERDVTNAVRMALEDSGGRPRTKRGDA